MIHCVALRILIVGNVRARSKKRKPKLKLKGRNYNRNDNTKSQAHDDDSFGAHIWRRITWKCGKRIKPASGQ